MDIRPTCAGIEGGRYGEEARTNAQGDPVPHWGVDFGGSNAEIGTEISAIEGGTVVSSDAYSTDFGNYVIIRNKDAENDDTWYLYAHLSKVAVEEGASIDEEKKIGEMGNSGNAAEADCNSVHLHLEVRKGEGSWPTDAGSKSRNPEKYIGTEFSSDGQPVSDEC
jgi:murein DD-endopeptidase MepM/ murein hydrolase activator NlpD